MKVPAEFSWDKKLNYWFRNIGTYIQDNFGFRATLPVLRRELRADLRSPDSRPFYAGRDGQLFWGASRRRSNPPAPWCGPPTWSAS
ncbi:hypothetical protein EZH22_19655 [Xanthobacter dioxanivorans]|uniref:Uncharacterized protein n=1 Tax=Xanthobacter dioxanivorans TaxID=2528964 RepID=A0A974PKK1_9HYPH|nr:hypothetical protein [Xanthobacter dioxanivorans]QRG05297.1 hypothetical protein EZH22_19655 [Xanthobacter dioxanivorans]